MRIDLPSSAARTALSGDWPGMTRTPTNGDDTRLSYGVAVRGDIAPMLSAELGVGYRKDELFAGTVESTQWPITASLWAHPLPMFYVGGGAGWYNTTLHYPKTPLDRKSTRLNSSHIPLSRMPSSA